MRLREQSLGGCRNCFTWDFVQQLAPAELNDAGHPGPCGGTGPAAAANARRSVQPPTLAALTPTSNAESQKPCRTLRQAKYAVYVELIFHDNQSHVKWVGSETNWDASVTRYAWLYGEAIDRAMSQLEST
ncbi:MAG: hypothetical protein KTU85_07540 [Acidimicrobiia bacterium]|nr:hypothetical protein [Acidimicrobiia bacterium]